MERKELKTSGLKNKYLPAYYKKSGYKVNPFSGSFDGKSYSWVANEMRNGRIVHLTWNSSAGAHASLISRIRYLNDFSKVRFSLKYLKDIFKLENLKAYSIPIFTRKKSKKNFINSIDFSSNPNQQRVIIEHIKNGKIVSEFNIIAKKFTGKEDEFVKIGNVLIYYKYDYESRIDFPILVGNPNKYFFTKERLEKKYFRFDVVGFKGTFILKNNKIFYVTKKTTSEKKIKDLSYVDEIKKSKTIYIEVDDNFLKKFKYN